MRFFFPNTKLIKSRFFLCPKRTAVRGSTSTRHNWLSRCPISTAFLPNRKPHNPYYQAHNYHKLCVRTSTTPMFATLNTTPTALRVRNPTPHCLPLRPTNTRLCSSTPECATGRWLTGQGADVSTEGVFYRHVYRVSGLQPEPVKIFR